jgi:N-acetylglucosamine-6-phosphate deacetylase
MKHAILAARLFDGEDFLAERAIVIETGRIVAQIPADALDPAIARARLADDVTLAPGFIDWQVNGGGDVLLNGDPSLAAIRTIATAHARAGVTGILPTLITDGPAKWDRLAAIADDALAIPGVLGFHLEGPFINPERKGIHRVDFIRAARAEDIGVLARFARGRSVVTLAPECVAPGFIRALVGAGLIVSAGHSEASAEQLARAADEGLRGVTHLYNAMSPMTARAPGMVGAALADDRIFAGVIADGLHVDPLALRVAHRAKGCHRLCLVSDAMPSVGGTRASFDLLGTPITLLNGRLTDPAGKLAGAHLSLIEAVKTMVTRVGVDLADALIMASRTPAEFLGLGARKGRIAVGYDADMVALGADLTVHQVWRAGRATA